MTVVSNLHARLNMFVSYDSGPLRERLHTCLFYRYDSGQFTCKANHVCFTTVIVIATVFSSYSLITCFLDFLNSK